jgi:hypothetical protein
MVTIVAWRNSPFWILTLPTQSVALQKARLLGLSSVKASTREGCGDELERDTNSIRHFDEIGWREKKECEIKGLCLDRTQRSVYEDSSVIYQQDEENEQDQRDRRVADSWKELAG